MQFSPGLHPDVPMSDYLKLAAVGGHDLTTLISECPAVALFHKMNPNSETLAKSFGTAMHTLTLEPEDFAARHAVRPVNGPRGNSNEYKAWAAEHVAAGREIITADDWARMQSMRSALPKAARRLLAKGRPEVTGLCLNEETGLMLKTRPDWMRDEGIITNVKTAADVHPQRWAYQARKLGYHIGAALCVDVLREITGETFEYNFLVMAKDPPFISHIVPLDPADEEAGRQLYQGALMTWAACEKAGEFPAYGDVVNVTIRDLRQPLAQEAA